MSRRGYIVAATIGVLTIVGVSVVHIAPKLIWNASASTPIGFYLIRSVDRVDSLPRIGQSAFTTFDRKIPEARCESF